MSTGGKWYQVLGIEDSPDFKDKISPSRGANRKIGELFEGAFRSFLESKGVLAEKHKVFSGGQMRHKGYDLDCYVGHRRKTLEVKAHWFKSYISKRSLFVKVISKFRGVRGSKNLVYFGGRFKEGFQCVRLLRQCGIRVIHALDFSDYTLRSVGEALGLLSPVIPDRIRVSNSSVCLSSGDDEGLSCLRPMERDLELVVLACLFDRCSLKFHGRGAEGFGFRVDSISNKVCRILLGPGVEWSDRSKVVIEDFIVGVASRYNSKFIRRADSSVGRAYFRWVGGKENKKKLSKLIKKDIEVCRVSIREFKKAKEIEKATSVAAIPSTFVNVPESRVVQVYNRGRGD